MARPFTNYIVTISGEFVTRFSEWTEVKSLGADWVRVVPNDNDGTAEVWFSVGPKPPTSGPHT